MRGHCVSRARGASLPPSFPRHPISSLATYTSSKQLLTKGVVTMETLLRWFAESLTSPGDLSQVEQLAAATIFALAMGSLAALRALSSATTVPPAHREDLDEAA